MAGSRKGRLLPTVVFGLVSAAVLVTIITQPRMRSLTAVQDPDFADFQLLQEVVQSNPVQVVQDDASLMQKKLNIHVNFVTPPPVAPVVQAPKPLNIHVHVVGSPPVPAPPAPKTHIHVHVINEPTPPTPPVPPPAGAVKVTKIVHHKNYVHENGTVTNETVVTIVTDETHTPPAPVPVPVPTEPAVPGHNIIVNVIKHGSVSPSEPPTIDDSHFTTSPSSPKGAIVVNVIDHKHPHSENDNEVEPSGELLPPDWAQHMGQNLPPAEPIGSDVGNPKVDIYAINFTDKTYYFEYCGKRYNEIPPRSVIGQETYGNEVWEIVADDGVVMIQAKVVEYNQRFIIKDALTQITTAQYH